MWFKNLMVYTLDPVWRATQTAAGIEERLARHPLLPVNQASMQSRGWVSAREGGELAWSVGSHIYLALGIEQRMLPASVINAQLKARALKLEQEQGFAPGRKQRRDLKDQVTDELRPKAFVTRRTVTGLLAGGYLIVNASSGSAADEFCSTLNAALEGLPALCLDTKIAPDAAMASWLSSYSEPTPFGLGDGVVLQADNIERSTVRYDRHAIRTPAIIEDIKAGKRPTQVSLEWRERAHLVLTDRLTVKRLRFIDVKEEQAEARNCDDAADADALLFAEEVTHLLGDLVATLGGIKQ